MCACVCGRVAGKGFGQSGNESVMLCKNIWFPWRKKKACQSPECNQKALCCSGCYDSDFPLRHWHSQADEKDTNSPLLHSTHSSPRLPTPLPLCKCVTRSWIIFLNRIHRVKQRKFSCALRLPYHQRNGEREGAHWLASKVWGEALYIMLIAHPPQLPFCTNYRKEKCKMSFFFYAPSVQ